MKFKLFILFNWCIINMIWGQNNRQYFMFNQRLDSLVKRRFDVNTNQWYNQWKWDFVYDSNNQLQTETYYENSYGWRWNYTYDSNADILSKIFTVFDNGQWVNNYKYEFTYDTNAYLTSEIDSWWNTGSNQWTYQWKKIFSYDTNGNKTLVTGLNWDASDMQWHNTFKYEYTYDSNNNLILELGQTWNNINNQWENSFKYEYIYDNNNQILTNIQYRWYHSNWEYVYRYEYTYDSHGNIIEKVGITWDGSQWENNTKNVYTFDSQQHMLSNINYLWNRNMNQWINSNKADYQYDNSGNRISEVDSYWQTTDNQWHYVFKNIYHFDLQQLFTDALMPPDHFHDEIEYNGNIFFVAQHTLAFQPINLPDFFDTYNYNNDDWSLNYKTTYYYSGPNAINNSSLLNMKVYPNPTHNFINFYLEKNQFSNNLYIQLYNIDGKIVLTQLNNSHKIYVGQLKKGIYFYKIIADNKTARGKIIIK